MGKSIRHLGVVVILTAVAASACEGEPPLVRLAQAQNLSANLLVQFLTAADAANKSVIADSDEAQAAFAGSARSAKQAVQADITSLDRLLLDLGYKPEADLLRTFASRFDEYSHLDDQILALAADNTNRRAQRLSFGSAQHEADAFRDAVAVLGPGPGKDQWQVKALAATAVAGVREIQALEAPHIAEAGDAEMTAIEKRMTATETATRSALRELSPLVSAPSRRQLEAANGALDRFLSVHAQITEFSRRNTNVRSLALTLNQKGRASESCEESLSALREALAKRGFAATR